MARISEYHYEIDTDDRIVDVSPAWLAFARRNDAAELTRERVCGESVYRFIAGLKLSDLYQRLFASLREFGHSVTVPFRCDSAQTKRVMELQLTPGLNGHIKCTGRLLQREKHRAIPLLDRHTKRSDQHLIICGVCRSLRLPDSDWGEIKEVLADPYITPTEGLPLLSHDVCPKCTAMLRSLALA